MDNLRDWIDTVDPKDLKVLSIGGSDPGGGAGVQQDVRTFCVLGAYGTFIPTALTAQNSLGIHDIEPLSPSFLEKEINLLLEDIPIRAVKIGMLHNQAIVDAVARALSAYSSKIPVVLDPVLASKDKRDLLDKEAMEPLLNKLFPISSVITPNIPEAQAILGMEINDRDDLITASRRLFELASQKASSVFKAVIIKGGHSKKEIVTDLLFTGMEFYEFSGERIHSPHTHGTGCAYSAAIATFIGSGLKIERATALAREFMDLSIRGGFSLGSGIGPVNTQALQKDLYESPMILDRLDAACSLLEESPKAHNLCPEIQINLGYATPNAVKRSEVAAFPGRIVRVGKRLKRVKDPRFGASWHISSIILSAMKFDRNIRSAMNIRIDDAFLERAKALGLRVGFFSRGEEPLDIKEIEGSSLSWGVKTAIKASGGIVPDLIYDDGDTGKEPVIRVLGTNPIEVVNKALSLIT